jgi:subtilisin family serine protease
LGRPETASDPEGHGTHVAGSALGDADSEILGVRVTGAAPGAKLVLQSVLDSQGALGGLPDDLHDLFLPPYQNDGARIHSNSWGSSLKTDGGVYNSNSSEVEDFVWNHRDCVICFASGNEADRFERDWAHRPRLMHTAGNGQELHYRRRDRERPARLR